MAKKDITPHDHKAANDGSVAPRKSSLSVISDNGNRVYGGAAQLVTIKRAGGFHNFVQGIITQTAQETAKRTVQEMQQQEQKNNDSRPMLKRVK